MTTRQDREREHHDRLFAADEGRAADRFYAISGRSFAAYERMLAPYGANSRVLEYGCGQTSYAFRLAAQGADVIAIDISPVAVKQSEQRALREGLEDRLQFRVMDAESLEFEDQTFDLVCGNGILHHLDLQRAYNEVARTLRDDGLAVFTEPLGHNPVVNLYRRMTPDQRTVDEHPLLVRDIETARRYFSKVDATSFYLASLMAIPLRNWSRFDAALRALDSVDILLFDKVPFLQRFAWTVLMVLRGPQRSDRFRPVQSPPGRVGSLEA